MTYMLENPEGQRFSAGSLEEISAAIHAGTIDERTWAWYEGLSEWIPVLSLFPQQSDKPSIEINAKKAVGAAAGFLAKAGVSMAGFAAKSYRKATLKNRFSAALATMLSDGKLDTEELSALEQMATEAGVKWDEVITECQPMAAQFIRHMLADAAVDGGIDYEEEAEISKNITLFRLSDGIKAEVSSTILRLRSLTALRNNRLPSPMSLNPPWIQSGEAVYGCQNAEIHKEGAALSQGRLWVTSVRVEYVAPKGGVSISLSRLREVKYESAYLSITSVRGKSDFRVTDAEVLAELLLSLLRLNNRTATAESGDTTQLRRRISKEVSNAVWIRDGGICVECEARDYLEYDHVIPVSKGGGNSVENIQLLCRRCNNKKSDRI